MSQSFSCPDCNISIDEVEPRSFSFNNPFGACPTCHGLGNKMEFDLELMIPDPKLSIAEGAIALPKVPLPFLDGSLVPIKKVIQERF